MTFEVPASKASIGQDVFKFKIPGRSGEFSVKRAKFLSVGDAEALETPDNASVVLDLFGKKGTKQGDAVRTLDTEQFQALVDAWQADSDVTLGESEASAS
jgi:hypothetical protein